MVASIAGISAGASFFIFYLQISYVKNIGAYGK